MSHSPNKIKKSKLVVDLQTTTELPKTIHKTLANSGLQVPDNIDFAYANRGSESLQKASMSPLE